MSHASLHNLRPVEQAKCRLANHVLWPARCLANPSPVLQREASKQKREAKWALVRHYALPSGFLWLRGLQAVEA